MATEKQVNANRQNSKRSTGPRSDKGKAKASQNAQKHGILSSQVLLASEDAELFNKLSEQLHNELCPIGVAEDLLVDRIIACTWRLRRILKFESCLFDESKVDITNVFGNILDRIKEYSTTADILIRYETTVARMLTRAYQELQCLQESRKAAWQSQPGIVDVTPLD